MRAPHSRSSPLRCPIRHARAPPRCAGGREGGRATIMPASPRAAARAYARRRARHSQDDLHVSAPQITACPSRVVHASALCAWPKRGQWCANGTQFCQRSWLRVNLATLITAFKWSSQLDRLIVNFTHTLSSFSAVFNAPPARLPRQTVGPQKLILQAIEAREAA